MDTTSNDDGDDKSGPASSVSSRSLVPYFQLFKLKHSLLETNAISSSFDNFYFFQCGIFALICIYMKNIDVSLLLWEIILIEILHKVFQISYANVLSKHGQYLQLTQSSNYFVSLFYPNLTKEASSQLFPMRIILIIFTPIVGIPRRFKYPQDIEDFRIIKFFFDNVAQVRKYCSQESEYFQICIKALSIIIKQNKQLFLQLKMSKTKNDLAKFAAQLMKVLDEKYYIFRKTAEVLMNEIPISYLIALYTNSASFDTIFQHLGTFFASRVCWDLLKFILALNPKLCKYLEEDPDNQKFANIMSMAFVLFIPTDKLIYVSIFLGVNDCVKNCSAFFKSEIFTFLKRTADDVRPKLKDLNQSLTEIKKNYPILKKKIYILSVELTTENSFKVDPAKYIDNCPTYLLESFFDEFINDPDLKPEEMVEKH